MGCSLGKDGDRGPARTEIRAASSLSKRQLVAAEVVEERRRSQAVESPAVAAAASSKYFAETKSSLDFDAVMENEIGAAAVLEFARSVLSEESVKFFLVATRWRRANEGLVAVA